MNRYKWLKQFRKTIASLSDDDLKYMYLREFKLHPITQRMLYSELNKRFYLWCS